MEEQTKLALASAVLGGYVLGRTKKGRLALTVATVVAGRGLGFGPKELAAEGARRLADVPQVAEVQEQVREQGFQAVRGALSAVTDRGIGSLADAISGRTASISRKADDADEEDDEDQAPEDSDDSEEEPEDEEEEPEEEELENEDESDEDESDEEGEPAPARRRKAAPERRGTRSAPKQKAPAKKAPAKKTAAKKTAPTKRAAKKTTSSRSSRRR
ncbi:histone protein [Streptomyces sp. NPDC057307]|uniref:histone protein n=1 Tax=Streptomyces sp. NPDC057307 TaxID=3346096 RepID=UPI00363216B3